MMVFPLSLSLSLEMPSVEFAHAPIFPSYVINISHFRSLALTTYNKSYASNLQTGKFGHLNAGFAREYSGIKHKFQKTHGFLKNWKVPSVFFFLDQASSLEMLYPMFSFEVLGTPLICCVDG
jgi:hypothetical protein